MGVRMNREELKALYQLEWVQKQEEGCDVSAFEKIPLDALSEESIRAVYHDLAKLEPVPECPYREPSDLEEILKERGEGVRARTHNLTQEQLLDRILGAWQGRAAGCLLGKPVEGWKRVDIDRLLEMAGKEELDDYFPFVESDVAPFSNLKNQMKCLSGHINGMASDDDLDYTIIALQVIEKYGRNFRTEDVMTEWLSLLPISRTYTAENVAYRNAVKGLLPPQTALEMNPYREWIGSQIRADLWGYVNPGNPEQAAQYAWRDARLSHVKNGIYGEMFFSALIASALVESNLETALSDALSEIPRSCRLYDAVLDVMEWCRQKSDWQWVYSQIMDKYGSYHPVHTINNAAFVIAGLLLSEGDYEKAIAISVRCGLDTDCNGATAGSVMGALLGAEKLPAKWIAPLQDFIESNVIGFARMSITELANRTLKQVV